MKGNWKLIDSTGKLVFSSLSPEEEAIFVAGKYGVMDVQGLGRTRLGVLKGVGGTAYLASRDPDLVKSARVFGAVLETILGGMDYTRGAIFAVQERLAANSKRLVHNLTSLNGHMIQDLYSVIPQERLAGNIRRSVPLLAAEMRGNKVEEFARCFLSLAKHSAAMKNEFSVFKKLDSLEVAIQRRAHSAHKILMNVAYLFFSDFADKGSYVNITPSDLKMSVDYECAFVAIYHMLDNAAKYICPGTDLDISIKQSGDKCELFFSMCSLPILEGELEKVAMEGFSGSYPQKLGLSGDGVGLGLISKVMYLHEGDLEITPDSSIRFVKNDVEYQRNTFSLRFSAA